MTERNRRSEQDRRFALAPQRFELDGDAAGPPVRKGIMGRVLTEYTVNLNPKRMGRYVRLVALSEVNGRPWS